MVNNKNNSEQMMSEAGGCLNLISQPYKLIRLGSIMDSTTNASRGRFESRSYVTHNSTEEFLQFLEETVDFSNVKGKYYAKVKGWELVSIEEDLIYWNLSGDKLYIDDNTGKIGPYGKKESALTLKEWRSVGITSDNAHFEKTKD